MSNDHRRTPASRFDMPRSARAPWIAAAMTALIGAFFLLREHWGHVAGVWVYLLLFACPALHLFHGRRVHGHHGHRDAGPARRAHRETQGTWT